MAHLTYLNYLSWQFYLSTQILRIEEELGNQASYAGENWKFPWLQVLRDKFLQLESYSTERWSFLFPPCSVFFKLGSEGKFNISKCSTSKPNVLTRCTRYSSSEWKEVILNSLCFHGPFQGLFTAQHYTQIEKENGCKRVLTHSGDTMHLLGFC